MGVVNYDWSNAANIDYNTLALLADRRYNATFFVQERYGRIKQLSEWKQAIIDDQDQDMGDQSVVTFPDGSRKRSKMNVQNIRHDSARNLMRLIGESMLSLVCDP